MRSAGRRSPNRARSNLDGRDGIELDPSTDPTGDFPRLPSGARRIKMISHRYRPPARRPILGSQDPIRRASPWDPFRLARAAARPALARRARAVALEGLARAPDRLDVGRRLRGAPD